MPASAHERETGDGAGARAPLTIGTAGHVDHGKTALVAALTGVDTDRLPEEKARGLTIALGYAALPLPSGRQLSLIDVPGHERFVRTMVSGASGIDMFLMVIAADDGVMPQTVEHARVLRSLAVSDGVVAISKSDLADPAPAIAAAAKLLPGASAVPCSARTRQGLAQLLGAIDQTARGIRGRAQSHAGTRLHVDRVFTVAGRGTVVTGTLWSGAIARGDLLEMLPSRTRGRVRGVQVHERTVDRACAGQRVAVNLVGVKPRELQRGEVLAAVGSLRETRVLDCALALEGARHGERVQVHHGTRAVPGRLARLGEDLWQLRLEQPLLALGGDRLVVRRIAPADTLGGGLVLEAHAKRHGPRPELLARLRALRDDASADLAATPPQPSLGKRAGAQPSAPPAGDGLDAARPDERSIASLELRLREAGTALLSEAQMEGQLPELRALREAGQAVRVSGRLYAHAVVLEDVRRRVVALIEREGPVSLAGVRDRLGISRKSAQAFLEHLDRERVTRRMPDDLRVLGAGQRAAAVASG
jgi:selenocysteine-specific elongation factor